MIDIKIEIRNKDCLELNENENVAYQNLGVTMKAVLGGKFIALSVCIKSRRDLILII